MLKGVIFDLDGTITLTEQLHYKAFLAVFKEYGIDFTFEEEAMKYAGSGSKNIFTNVFRERGKAVSEEEIEKCVVKKRKLYKKIIQQEPILVVAGVKEFVGKIEKEGLKKIIATGNGDLEAVRFILGRVGLAEHFPDILSITEVKRGKPFPDVFLEAARRLGLKPEECVVLEDAVNGVTAAVAAGIRCIALESTTKREDLFSAGAADVVKNYFEITNRILYGSNNT